MTDSLCVFCGTARRGSVALCPTCGRPWIDQVPAEAAVSTPLVRRGDATVATVTKDGKTAEVPPLPAPSPPPNRTPWYIAAAADIGAIALYVLFFGVWISGEGEDDPTAVVSLPPTSVTPTTPPPTTATTAAPTTTTSSTTTTSTTTTLPLIPAAGAPVPLDELTLGAFALGPFDFGDSASATLGRLVQTERRHRVHQALADLNPDHRAVVVLRWIDGLSTKEAAVALGIPEGTVMSRLSRAMDRLAVTLKEEYGSSKGDRDAG